MSTDLPDPIRAAGRILAAARAERDARGATTGADRGRPVASQCELAKGVNTKSRPVGAASSRRPDLGLSVALGTDGGGPR